MIAWLLAAGALSVLGDSRDFVDGWDESKDRASVVMSVSYPKPYVMEYSTFYVPFEVKEEANPPQRDKIHSVRLYVSRDCGLTWNLVASEEVQRGRFEYKASEDGLHLFTTQKVYVDGHRSPQVLRNVRRADLAVIVKTER